MGRGDGGSDLLGDVERFGIDETAASLAAQSERLRRELIDQLQGFARELDQVVGSDPLVRSADDKFLEALLDNRERWLQAIDSSDPELNEAWSAALDAFHDLAVRRTGNAIVLTLDEWLGQAIEVTGLERDGTLSTKELAEAHRHSTLALTDELRRYEEGLPESRINELRGFLQVQARDSRLCSLSLICARRLLALDPQERVRRIVRTPQLYEAVAREYEPFDGSEWFGEDALARTFEAGFHLCEIGPAEGIEGVFEADVVARLFPRVVQGFYKQAQELINSNTLPDDAVTRLFNLTYNWTRQHAELVYQEKG